MRRSLLPSLALVLLHCGTAAHAGLTGSIQGRLVVQGTQLVPQDARITAAGIIIDVAHDGTYVLGPLRAGKYDVVAEWPEVGIQVKTDIQVNPDDASVVDFVFPPPKPVIRNIFPPVVNRVRSVTIHGDHFLHAAKGVLEVLIGEKTITATRLDNETIEIRNEAISQLFKQIGPTKAAVELPVQIKVNGLVSNDAKFALLNITPGNIQGRVIADNSRIPLLGAQVMIPYRNLKQTLPAGGAFNFLKLPPRLYLVTLDWPAAGLKTDQKLEVLPGQTTTATFQVKIPIPALKGTSPEVIERSTPLTLRGNYLFHSAKAPYEVRVNDRPVPAIRISNQILEVGETTVSQLWKAVPPGETVEHTFTVHVAGQQSEVLRVKFKGPSPPTAAPAPSPAVPPPRDVATDEKPKAN